MYRNQETGLVLANSTPKPQGSLWCRLLGHKSFSVKWGSYLENYTAVVFYSSCNLLMFKSYCERCAEPVSQIVRPFFYDETKFESQHHFDIVRYNSHIDHKTGIMIVDKPSIISFKTGLNLVVIKSFEDYQRLLFEGTIETKKAFFSKWQKLKFFDSSEEILVNLKTFEARPISKGNKS